jgi:hypothetical protein
LIVYGCVRALTAAVVGVTVAVKTIYGLPLTLPDVAWQSGLD